MNELEINIQVDLMVKKIETLFNKKFLDDVYHAKGNIYWDAIINFSVENNSLNQLKIAIDQCIEEFNGEDIIEDFRKAFLNACSCGHLSIVQYFMEPKRIHFSSKTIEQGKSISETNKHKNVFDFLESCNF
jgi:hypothetical protein